MRVSERWTELHSEDRYTLYSSQNVRPITMTKSWGVEVSEACSTYGEDEKFTYNFSQETSMKQIASESQM